MSDLGILLRGLLIGVICAAPVGPVALVLMKTTVDQGLPAGWAVGLGATLADFAYAVMAAFGIAALSGFLIEYQTPMRLGGGALMLVLAALEWRETPHDPTQLKEAANLPGSALLGFSMAFSNPLTALGFAAVFIAFGFSHIVLGMASKTLLVLGVTLGSALWWLGLALAIQHGQKLLTPAGQRMMSRGTAILLLIFGLYAVVTAYTGPILFDPAAG